LAFTVALPLDAPQDAGLVEVTAVNAGGSEIVTETELMHPFASVTVTE
jgi:hypothetical protein